eukprot:SAG22_NODE_1980_length_3211_cov_1.089010_3_plen_66_part_00
MSGMAQSAQNRLVCPPIVCRDGTTVHLVEGEYGVQTGIYVYISVVLRMSSNLEMRKACSDAPRCV